MSTDQQAGAKKRGRPSLPEDDRRSTHLKFRTRPGVREKIEAAAAANGRSASEEVEFRIEQSFSEKAISDSVSEAASETMTKLYDAFATQSVHSTLKELQNDLGHPWSLPIAFYIGQGFTDFHEMMRIKRPDEIWFDNPERMKEAATCMHRRVDSLFANWGPIVHGITMWGLFQEYLSRIFRKKADGTYVKEAEEDQMRRGAEGQNSAEA